MILFKKEYKNFRFFSEIPGISGTFTNTKAEIYGIPYIHLLAPILIKKRNEQK